MMQRLLILITSLFISFGVFSIFGQSIETFNAHIRTFISQGQFTKFKFSPEGIPSQVNARIGEYTSPFYVVHFGLMYSETCKQEALENRFHWAEDTTAKYWPGAPDEISQERFRNSLEWLLKAVTYDEKGNAHFIYDFSWPYKGYPGGSLAPGWWSGLTDGYAIVLLLRGYDCFEDEQYLTLADELYNSVLTPVEMGGSLIFWEGQPWIEESVAPSAPLTALSRVLNGMAYAYFGVKSYEEFINQASMSSDLFASMTAHIGIYDLGYWSYYDAIGSRANIKYHAVNWSLITDPRLAGVASEQAMRSWGIGKMFPFIYLFQGPPSYALLHAWLTVFVFLIFCYLSIQKLTSLLLK